MSDAEPARRTRSRADAPAAVVAASKPSKIVKTAKYVIRDGCGIFLEHRVKSVGGEVIELTKEQARKYTKLRLIDPFLDDEEDDDAC